MSDNLIQDIRDQVAEINRKTPRITPLMIKTIWWLLVLFLFLVMVDLTLMDRIKTWTKRPVDSWNNVQVLTDRNELATAYEMALRLEKKAPSNYYGYFLKGRLLIAMNRMEEAVEQLRKAYALFPDDVIAEELAVSTKALEQKK